MTSTATYDISLDTPISLLTPRQLFEMQSQWMASVAASAPKPKEAVTVKEKWHVNSIKELADILGTSESTVYRMKREGLLNECISQCGKWMVIDVNGVLEKFRLSNQGRRKNKRVHS